LDVAGGIHFSPGAVDGEIIGGGNEINLVSGSQVNGDNGGGTGVPLPSTALAGMVLLGGCALVRTVHLARGKA